MICSNKLTHFTYFHIWLLLGERCKPTYGYYRVNPSKALWSSLDILWGLVEKWNVKMDFMLGTLESNNRLKTALQCELLRINRVYFPISSCGANPDPQHHPHSRKTWTN